MKSFSCFCISPSKDFLHELADGIKARHSSLTQGLIILPNEVSRSVCESHFGRGKGPKCRSLGSIFFGSRTTLKETDCFFHFLREGENQKSNMSLVDLLFTMREQDVPLVPSGESSQHIEKSLSLVEEMKESWESYLEKSGLEDLPLHRKRVAASYPAKLLEEHDFVYLAGSTCSNLYAKQFARGLLQNGGYLVLSALDTKGLNTLWQMHLRQLLNYLKISVDRVKQWNGGKEDCQDIFNSFSPKPTAIKRDITIQLCDNELEEGFFCSKVLKEGIENGKKVALVTSDQYLADRIAWELRDEKPYSFFDIDSEHLRGKNLIFLASRFLFDRSIHPHQLLLLTGKKESQEEENHIEKMRRLPKNWEDLWELHKQFTLWADEEMAPFLKELDDFLSKYFPTLNQEVNFDTWNRILNASLERLGNFGSLSCPPPNSPLVIGNFVETRLLHFDRVVIGAATEDRIRPSRNFFEDEILKGLGKGESVSSHVEYDFARLVCKGEVFISHTGVPSSFVTRLENLLGRKDSPSRCVMREPNSRENTSQKGHVREIREEFPDVISVSDLDLLMHNPYAFYAKKILNLREKTWFQEFGNKEAGSLIHSILEKFVSEIWNDSGDLAYMKRALIELIKEEFEKKDGGKMQVPGFISFASEFVKWQSERSKKVRKTFVEQEFCCPFKKFKVKGRLDRVDIMEDGSISVVDYKRTIPKASRQLHLYALLVEMDGRFGSFEKYSLEYLKYGGKLARKIQKKTRDEVLSMKAIVDELEMKREFCPNEVIGKEYFHMAEEMICEK